MADARLKVYGGALAVAVLDRLTKWVIETRVSFVDTYRVIPGFFDIVHSQNRGVAFGIFNDATSEWRSILLALFSIAAAVWVAVVLWRPERLDRRSLWGFVLVLGGALGNVFDRLVFGRVTDFLELYVGQYHWPTFNLADSAIVIGCGLLLLDVLKPKRQAAST